MPIPLDELLAMHHKRPQPGYTFSELAVLYNVTEQSIRKYVTDGRLQAFKTSPGKSGKVRHDDADRFLRESNDRRH